MMTTLNILLIEDNPGDARLIKELLNENSWFRADITTARTLKTGIERLAGSSFDIILLDLSLPDSAGEETFLELHRHSGMIPIVLISGISDDEIVLTMIHHGAQDFINKSSLSTVQLARTIQFTIERNELQKKIIKESELRKQTEEVLRRSEQELLEAQRIARLGNWSLNLAEGRLLWSEEMYRIYGVEKKTFPHTRDAFLQLLHPDDRSIMAGWINDAMQKKNPNSIVFRVRHQDGSEHYVKGDGTLIVGADGRPEGMLGTAQDITDRMQSEIQIMKLNRMHSILSNINQLIVRTDDIGKVFQEACSIVVRDGHFLLAWIGIKNDATGTIDVAAQAGIGTDYLQKIDSMFNDITQSIGPTGQTIRSGFRQIISDGESDISMTKWNTEAAKRGILSSASFPLIVNGNVIGAFSLYSGEKNFFTSDECALLDELSMDISFAMEIREKEAERQTMEEALTKNERQYRDLFQANPLSMWVYELETLRIIAVNDRAIAHYGYSREEFLGLTIKDIRPIEDLPKLLKHLQQRIDGLQESGVWKHRKKNGEIIDVEIVSHSLLYGGKKAKLVLANDITQRILAEEKLRESEAQFKLLLNSIDGIVWEADAKTFQFSFVSDQSKRILGYEPMRWISEPDFWKDHIHPEDREAAISFCKKATEEKKKHTLEYRMMASDGRSVWLRDIVYVIVKDDKPYRLRGLLIDITEQKRSQEALKESEAQATTIMESTDNGILAVDEKGTIIKTNKRFAELWNIPSDILASGEDDKVIRFVLEQLVDPEQFLKKVQLLYNSHGKDLDTIYFKDGRIFERSSAPLLVDDRIAGRVWSFRDITDRKQNEAALIESERRYRAIVENVRQAYFEADPRSLFTYCNPGLIIISGYSMEELLGTSSLRLVAEDHREWVVQQYRRWTNERRRETSAEFMVQKKNGDVFWVEQISHFDYDVNGRLINSTNYLRDIDERKKAEHHIKMLAHALSSISDCVSITDLNENIIFVNKAFCTTYGYSFEEINGQHISILRTGRKDEISLHDIADRTQRGGWRGELVNRKKNGDTFTIELSTSVIRNEQGKEIAHIGVAQDITERKAIESELVRNKEKLQNIIENSTNVFYTHDKEHILHFISPQIKELLGYNVEESLVHWKSFTSENLINEIGFQKTVKAVATGKIQGPYELELVHKDGHRVWVEVREAPVVENGETVLIVGSLTDITDRKIAEERLRENEERLRLSLQASQQGLFDLNIITGETLVNGEYAAMLGYDPKTFVETNDAWIERLHPDDKERTAKAYTDYISGISKEYRVEFRQRTSGGEWKWILSIGRIISYTDDGKPMRMLGIHTDIDTFKLAEEMQLLQTTALESAANGIIITDIQGKIVWANNAFSRITGYSLQEAIGAKPNLMKSGKQPQQFYEMLWNTILSGQTWSGSIVNKKKNGTLYDDEMTITPVRNDKQQITHFVAVKQDVTERNQSIKRIEEQALLLDEAHEAIIVRDMDFMVLFWNKGAERIFGWTIEEAIGNDLRSLIFPKRDDYTMEHERLGRAGNYTGEFIFVTKLKKRITMDLRLTVINDGQGNPKSVLAMGNDITEKKIIVEQFLRTQRMGSLGTLASGIAHDLNNVLAPIMLSIEILKKNTPNEMSQKILESVESSARRGAEIVKQILTFARGIETQKIILQPRHVIKEVVGIFKETFPRSITIEIDIPNSTWTIIADPTHLHQLIMNLGVNARDAMPEGGHLFISASNEEIDEQYARMNIDSAVGRYVMISIKDSGFGMPPAILEHIFEPFFTTKEIGKGTGLGLSTVYTIVKSHNGFIKVYSEPGKGSTFHIYLPAADSSITASDVSETKADYSGHGELILVVDDEKSIREVTMRTLEVFNYSVITANDGADAIMKYSEHHEMIALVITDMMMPVMDGHHLIITLRKMNPLVKIIASSGLIDLHSKIGFDDLNVNGTIEKPYTAQRLMSVVSSVLKEKK